jgi:hypothetical protein
VTDRGLGHLTEDGDPCPHHGEPDLEAVLALAVLGSRHTGFNHDLASKLQGILMSLDEILESPQATGDPDLQRAAESAMTSAQELGALLNANRALGRVANRSRAPLRDVLQQAGSRAGVAIRGTIVEASVEAAIAGLVQGLALAIDVCAGPGRGRSLDVTSTLAGATIELDLPMVRPAPDPQNELLALAVSVLRREGGELRCARGGDRMLIRLLAV